MTVIYPIPMKEPKKEWLNEHGESHLYIVKTYVKRWTRTRKPKTIHWWGVRE